MSGGRRPRTQKRRVGQPRTLRARLVVASVVLIATVCAVIGTVTTLALRSHLYGQLNEQLKQVSGRAAGYGGPLGGAPGSKNSAPGSKSSALDSKSSVPGIGNLVPGSRNSAGRYNAQTINLTEFVTHGPQPERTVIAKLQKGHITDAKYGERSDESTDLSGMVPNSLSEAARTSLNTVPQDGRIHTVEISGLGKYIAKYVTSENGSYYVAVPTKVPDSTIDTLILVEVSVTAAGLGAAVIAGYVLVGVATRPLRKVAATATRVSELPLHTGEVNLSERVPGSETDPHTEVGQVGAALNRMLDHVHAALHSRQQSETRVRQFVADASHELRTPLASIRGYAELTRRGREQVGPDTRHALGRIESEAARMTLLVEDLLLLARLNSGRPLQFEQTDLIPLVVDTISDSRAAGMDHNWRLDLPDEPALVSADAARIQQVLVNLLGNARKHTAPGTTITARIQRRGPWMCVDVEDNGQGIPPELLPHVFERFARGDSSRSRASGSTGLGLAIVQAVATAHGGAVTVDSVPGRTVFTVHLPALAPAMPRPAPETNRQSHSQADHSATTWVRQGT